MSNIDVELENFVKRIKKHLQLTNKRQNRYHSQLFQWLEQEKARLQEDVKKSQTKRSSGRSFIPQFLRKNKDSAEVSGAETLIAEILHLEQLMETMIPMEYVLPDGLKPSAGIVQALDMLKGNKIDRDCFEVKGPFMTGDQYCSNQVFKKLMDRKVDSDGIKFVRIGPQQVQRFQRMFIRELFGRIFRTKGALSIVLQFLPQKDSHSSPTYFLVADVILNKDCIVPLQNIVQSNERLVDKESQLPVSVDSFLEEMVSELMTLPLQTIVPGFIGVKENNEVNIMRWHSTKQQDILEHASLRSPLLFFREYFTSQAIPIDKIMGIIQRPGVYKRYFTALQVALDIRQHDFFVSFVSNERSKSVPSLILSQQALIMLTNIFHRVVMCQKWLRQVVRPIRETINLQQLLQQVWPILQEINVLKAKDLKEYLNHVQKLDIDDYLTRNISSKSLSHYLDIYRIFNIDMLNKEYVNTSENSTLEQRIHILFQRHNIESYPLEEAVHLIQFYLRNSKKMQDLPECWRNIDLWKRLFKYIDEKPIDTGFLDFNIQLCPYYLGFDLISLNIRNSLALLENTEENQQNIQKLVNFIVFLKARQPWVARSHILLFFNRCLKYKKIYFCQSLLNEDVKDMDLDMLFDLVECPEINSKTKEEFLDLIRVEHPETYRKYKWSLIFKKYLLKPSEIEFHSFDYGAAFLSPQLLRSITLQSEHRLHLNNQIISRNDYMYTLSQDISKLRHPNFECYIEQVKLPGIDFFFGQLLKNLNTRYIKPLTTYIVLHDTYFQLTESLSEGFSIPQAFRMYKQNQITNLLDRNVLSQAIITTMLINPRKITFDDVIIKKVPEDKTYHMYIKSIGSYSSHSQTLEDQDPKLRVKNCLLLLDIMDETIPLEVLKKFSSINIYETVRKLFNNLQRFNKAAQDLRTKLSKEKGSFSYQLPFLGIPFEKDFVAWLCYRMFVVADIFKKELSGQPNKKISHNELLQIIDSPLALYYRKVRQSSSSILQRWDLLEKYELAGVGFVKDSLFRFFSGFTWWEISEESNFPDDIEKLNFVGPSQSLLLMSEEQSKSQVFVRKEPEDIITMLKLASLDIISFFMRHLDMSQYPVASQEEMINIYAEHSKKYLENPKKYTALRSWNVFGCKILSDKIWNSFSFERIEQVTLKNCEKLTEQDLAYLSSKLPCVRYIRFSRIAGLQSFSCRKHVTAINEDPMSFKVLQTLVIDECPDIILVDIKSTALNHVLISNNFKLQNIFTLSNSTLNINCIANPKLRFQNLAVYVIQGCNVLVDEISCQGQFSKVTTNQDESRDGYTQRVCQVFTHLLSRFDDGQVKTNMLTTMFRLQILDNNITNELFTFFSDLMRKYVSSTIKLTPKLTDELLSNIIRCFFKNNRIQQIYLDDFSILDGELKGKTMGRLVHNLNEVCKNTPVQYRTLRIQKTLNDQSLDTLVEAAKHIQTQDTLQVYIDSFHVKTAAHLAIVKNLCRPGTMLEKLKMTLSKTVIDRVLFEQIIEACADKLTNLRFIECEVTIDQITGKRTLERCKSLIVDRCKYEDALPLLDYLPNLSYFECSKSLNTNLEAALNKLSKMPHLTKLSFKYPKELQGILKHLATTRIESFQLANCKLSKSNMDALNTAFDTVDTKELILKDITIDEQYDLSKFLLHTKHLRKVLFAHDNLKQINQFIESLGLNDSITEFQLNCIAEYTGLNLQPLRKNTSLQSFKFNHRLPIWLINKINDNSYHKLSRSSKIYMSIVDSLYNLTNVRPTVDYFKIGLSLDGGGMRGMLLASQLNWLVNKVKKPLHKIFDCIGGTSIGGILSLSVTATFDGINPVCDHNQIMEIFTKYGPSIFCKSNMTSITSLFGAKYPGTGIETVLNDYFKDCKLSRVLRGTSVIVTSVKRLDNRVKIFKSKEAILDVEKDFFMKDVARATSAAPTYFPAAQIKNVQATKQYSLIDGGIGLNNPSKLVVDEVKKLAVNQGADENYFLLSLGTGRTKEAGIVKNAGLINAIPVIDSFTESSNYFIERDIAQNYRGHYLRVSPYFETAKKELELDNTSAQILSLYKNEGVKAAEEYFENYCVFGPYRDRSLVEWLAENTARKHD